MSDNKYYEKIRKYARRALNSDLKTYIRGRDLYMYGTVDMSEYVKQSVFDDTVEELEGKIQDLDDKKANKSDVYTKDETDDKFLTKDDASKTYQPKGDYITKDEASDEYQPKGDYATVTYVDNADAILLNQINLKQDTLIPGSNITIVDNVISATGGGGSGIDKISASGTSPLVLKASVSGTSATITGSVNIATNDTLGVASVRDENGLHIIDDEYASNNGEIYLTLVSATENGAISAEDKMRLDELWEDYIQRKSVEYDIPVVELSYPNVPNGGGTSSPIINYSLTWRIDGVEQTPITSGAELKYELVENLNPNYYTVNVDESTGKVTATATSVSHEQAIDLCNVKVTVTLNSKSGEDTAVVVVSNKETTYTESLTILTFNYNDGEIIPAEGGTYSPNLVVVYTKINDITGEIVEEKIVIPDDTTYRTLSTIDEGFSLEDALTGVLDVEASTRYVSASVEVLVRVTYGDLSASTVTTVTRAGKDPEIEYSLEATLLYNDGNNIPCEGGKYSGEVTAYLITKVNGTETGRDTVTPDSTFYTMEPTEWAKLENESTGLINWEENPDSGSRNLVVGVDVYYTAPNGEELKAEAGGVVYQDGQEPTIEYSLEATLQYNGGSHIPKEGGPYSGEVTAQLITMVNGVETGRDTVTPDSTFYTMEPTEWAKLENEGTGLINWDENPDSGTRNIVITVNVYYTAPDGTELEAVAGGEIFQDGQEPEIKYELEITEFNYPAVGYTYEAHDRINASNLTVMFNTYQGKVLIDSVEVTSECDFRYSPNVNWISIPSLHMAGELLPINIAENTTTEQREGTVHLVATYGEYTAEADSNTILQGAGPEKEYKLEITEFNYPAVGYTYMAHENIDVSSLTVMFNTYQNKVLIDSTDVTNDCTLEITPNVDWITRPLLSLKNSTIINISENTTTEQREGTVHLVATYGEYTAEADSNTILQGAKPDEYSYSLNIANFQYHTSAGTNVIPADGCTNVSPDLAVLLMTVNTSTGYTTGTQITPTSSYYEITNGGSIDSSTGAITISSNMSTTAKTYTVTGEFKYIAPNGEELEASKSVTLTQSAPEITYSLEISSFSYNGGNNIPAEGGPFYPDLVVSLNTTQGAKSSASRVTPDSTFYTMEYTEWADLENEGTGLVTWDENTDSHSRSIVFTVKAWYTAPNGEELTAEENCIVYQDGYDPEIKYDTPVVELSYDDVPNGGGTSTPNLSYSQNWTEDGVAQTPITSGGTVVYELVENLNSSLYDVDVDVNTGVITATHTSMTHAQKVDLCTVKATVTLNGMPGEKTVTVCAAAREGAAIDPTVVIKEVEEKLSLDVSSGYRLIATGAYTHEPSTGTNNSVMSEEATLPAGCQLVITVNQDSFGLRCVEGSDSQFDEPLENSFASVGVGLFVNGSDTPFSSFGGGSITGTGKAGEDSYSTCFLNNSTITIPAADEDRVIQLGIAVMNMKLRYMCNIYLTTAINVSAEATITN